MEQRKKEIQKKGRKAGQTEVKKSRKKASL